MKRYYVNPNSQPNGDHEVHTTGCSWLALIKQPRDLGVYYTCAGAVQQARLLGYNANGCAYCCPQCHTR